MSTIELTPTTNTAEELAERLFNATIGAMDIFAVYIGDRLGYYQALAVQGPATSIELAQRTGTSERYTREWLEQQAVSDLLDVDNQDGGATERRYQIPDGCEEVFANPDSLLTMTPMAQIFAGTVSPLQAVLDAFRTGGGVPYEDYGPDLAEGQAGTTRPQFTHLLAQVWIPALPDIHARLQADPPARVADIGMGLGWSSIALAKAFPKIRVDGYDLDDASVDEASRNAHVEGVADRATFHARDAAEVTDAGQYDFALAIECIHDMSDPVGVLAAMKRLVGDGGTALIVDEKVADRFSAPGDEVERYMYGFSVLHCLPAGMAEQPSAATGTVMRADTLSRYAADAGFHSVEILPVEHDFFRFYRLTG